MALGVLAILLAAFLNAFIVLIPLFIANGIASSIIAFLKRLKVRNDRMNVAIKACLLPLGVFFAAALQMHLWELVPGQTQWQWVFAGGIYLVGVFLMLLRKIPETYSPLERAWAANRFVISGLVMLVTLGISFRNERVYSFIYSTPKTMAVFLVGSFHGHP